MNHPGNFLIRNLKIAVMPFVVLEFVNYNFLCGHKSSYALLSILIYCVGISEHTPFSSMSLYDTRAS